MTEASRHPGDEPHKLSTPSSPHTTNCSTSRLSGDYTCIASTGFPASARTKPATAVTTARAHTRQIIRDSTNTQSVATASPQLSSSETCKPSPSVRLPLPHVRPNTAYNASTSGYSVAGTDSTLTAPLRVLSRRLTNQNPTQTDTPPSQRPARRLLWKSTSALPTLSTVPALSGTSTPNNASMSTHTKSDGLSAQNASDLLRQAMMQSRTANDAEEQDQIGSGSSTPPGAATPRPDPTDKRLPGILHSYFGQVRDSLRTRTKSENCPAPTQSLPSSQSQEKESGFQPMMFLSNASDTEQKAPLATCLPTAPCSPSEAQTEPKGSPPLPSSGVAVTSQLPGCGMTFLPFFYPTPPASSSSSVHQEVKEDQGSQSMARSPSICALFNKEKTESSEKSHTKSPSKSRRNTFGISSPLSNIVTKSDVPAAILSNPAQDSSAQPSSPNTTHVTSLRRLSTMHQSQEKVEKLTEGGSTPPRVQNTPPHTPRSQSTESKTATTPSRFAPKTSASSSSSNHHVQLPKGKLNVSITEGRGLKPSVDPYIVCQFQWAEYISEGPREPNRRAGEGMETNPAAIAMRRQDSDLGHSMAIPMRSRQSSNSGTSSDPRQNGRQIMNPKWEHDAIFDVVGERSEIDISVYDKSNHEAFLGHVRLCPNLVEYNKPLDDWFPLEAREGDGGEHTVTGEIHLRISFQKSEKKHYGPEDFKILKLIGKGTFGQVFQVRKKDTQRIYAMKVLSKKVIVQKKEVAHTLGERNILVRTAMDDSPFIVGLKFSFQTPTDLYLVTDYMSGGELFWHLQKEGRFMEDRAKFYIAELILALEHLHKHDIVYRDLKPENILLDAKGHIALCDFGLSKADLTEDATTNTFCGTTEYLAPEVLLDEHGYTKMVDFWSLGVLVFEMCCGWSPFYAEDTQQMYKNIAFGKVRFPRDALSTEGRNFVKGLLNRNPKHRLGATRDAEELKAHAFFNDIDWDALTKKNVTPPFKPKLKSEDDVQNFDPEFTNALASGVGSLNARAAALASGVNPASTPLSPTMQANFKGFTFVDESTIDKQFKDRDVDDRMDEDEDWDKPFTSKRGDRMSGIIQDNNDDSIFNGRFDV